jgi:uncharacterized repeat protein (TIGR01451 family)
MMNRKQALALALMVSAGAAGSANAQLIAGSGSATAPSSGYAYNFGTNSWVPLFSGAEVWGITADNANNRLLIASSGNRLLSWPYSDLGNNTVPTTIGTFTFNAASTNFVGLAMNPANGLLYGVRNIAVEAVYQIDPTTAVATSLFTYATSLDLGGLEFNPADGFLYATNDAGGTAVSGLYRIDLAAQTVTRVIGFPLFTGSGTAAAPDIDGLGVGALPGGDMKGYYIVDEPGQTGVYNFVTNANESPLTNPWPASYTFSGGAWVANLFAPPTGADVQITKTDSPDPVLPPGGQITYTITVRNNGPEQATSVQVNDILPGNVTFVSVGAPGVHNNGVITASLGTLNNGDSVSFPIVVQTQNIEGDVSNTATVTTTANDPTPGNNQSTAVTTVRGPRADVSVVITDPSDCAVGAGGTVGYTFAVRNNGTETANDTQIVISLPSNANFLNSNPPGTPVGNTLTLNLGALADAQTVNVTVDMQALNAGDILTMGASVSATEQDPNAGNNTDSEDFRVRPDAPLTAVAKAIFSTIPASPTSLVPGGGGTRFSSTGGIGKPMPSPNGSRWIVSVDTDAPTATDEVLLVGQATTFAVAAQEGITAMPTGFVIDTSGFDAVYGINNSGQYVFSGNDTNTVTAADELTVRFNGTVFELVSREGDVCPAFAPSAYGTTTGSATIDEQGRVSFYTNIAGLPTTQDTALLFNNGNNVAAQEGVTVPTNQATGPFTYRTFDTGATLNLGYFQDGVAGNFIATGNVNDSSTPSRDEVFVVNNRVVVQENEILAGSGFTSPTDDLSPYDQVSIAPGGNFVVIGDNNDDQDWVIAGDSSGAFNVVAVRDNPITPGNTIVWAEAGFPATFFSAAVNSRGDYVVGGLTSEPNALSNAKVVLNGRRVVISENDPVDLDGNGQFDDDTYIRTFRDETMYLTTCRQLVFVARLRNGNAALCGGTDTDIGQALITIQLPLAADFNNDGSVDFFDYLDFVQAFDSEDPSADFNGDQTVDFFDYLDFVAAFDGDSACS